MKRLFLPIILFAIFCNTAASQVNSAKPQIFHKVLAGFGYGYNSFFSGIAGNVGYEFHFDKNFISANFYQFKEFQALASNGYESQRATDLCLLYNRELVAKKMNLSMGAGVARTTIVADIENFIEPPSPGTFSGMQPVEQEVVGFPVNLNLSNTNRKFTAGIGLHSNFNSIVNLYEANIFFIYKF